MNAYKVHYEAGMTHTSVIVLSPDVENVPYKLAEKDKEFKVDDRWSVIKQCKQIPLSNVLVSELSITELLTMLKEEAK